jgi:hypothetical protein
VQDLGGQQAAAARPAVLQAGERFSPGGVGVFPPGSVVLLNGLFLPTSVFGGVLQALLSRKLFGRHHQIHATLLVFVPGVGVSAPLSLTLSLPR